MSGTLGAMDLRTLLVADLALQIGCAAVLELMSRNLTGMYGLRWLSWAYVTATVGMGMALAGNQVDNAWLLTVGRCLALVAAILISQCAAEFTVPRSSVFGWGAALLLCYCSLAFTVLREPQHYLWAVSLLCLCFGGQLMVAVFLLFSNQTPGERTASRCTGAMIGGVAFLALLRAVLAPLLRISPDMFQSNPLRLGGLLVFMLFLCGMAFGFVWMMMARLRLQLEHQARTDSLTGILNRRAVEVQGERLLADCRRRNLPFAVLAIDLDHFKALNDAHGHAAGDAVLAASARVLSQNLRATDLLARFGGEEFLAVLPERDGALALAIAERLRGRIANLEVAFDDLVLTVTASLGIATLRPDGDSWDALLRRADRALYDAKQAGRNCTRHALPELTAVALRQDEVHAASASAR